MSELRERGRLAGVTEDRFVVKDDMLIRARRLQKLNKRANTPEALRQRDIDPWTGKAVG